MRLIINGIFHLAHIWHSCIKADVVREGTLNYVWLLAKGHPDHMDLIFTIIERWSQKLFCPVSCTPNDSVPVQLQTTCLPPFVLLFRRVSVVLSHTVFVSYEPGWCWAPMVTCEPSKQDKLCAHSSWLALHDNKTPTRGSHCRPIQMSAMAFEVAGHYVNPQSFSPLTSTPEQERRQKVVLWC